MIDEFLTRGTGIERSQSVMWAGTVRSLRLADQVRTTALAGFGGISITPLGWIQALSEGVSSGDIRALCADNGIWRIHLDPFTRWSSLWQPANLDPAVFPLSFFAFEADDFLRIAEALGAASMTAIATFPHDAVGQEQMTEDFARLCDRAADHGLHCSLEFIPLDWGVPDLETAWSIVRDADRANSGIVLDTWCFQRSRSTLELLESIPGERIDFVQVADGLARVPKNRSWVEDNLDNRLPAGAGAFPLGDILSTLARTGGLNSVGPELFSWQLDAMSPEQIAEVSRSSLAEAADGAGIAHDLGAPVSGWRAVVEGVEPAPAVQTAPTRSHI